MSLTAVVGRLVIENNKVFIQPEFDKDNLVEVPLFARLEVCNDLKYQRVSVRSVLTALDMYDGFLYAGLDAIALVER